MTKTILTQTLTEPMLGNLLPIIGLAVFGWLVYKAVIKKEDAYRALLSGRQALVPIFALVAMALIPASTIGLFGVASPLISFIFELATITFIGALLAIMVVYLDSIVEAEKAVPGLA